MALEQMTSTGTFGIRAAFPHVDRAPLRHLIEALSNAISNPLPACIMVTISFSPSLLLVYVVLLFFCSCLHVCSCVEWFVLSCGLITYSW